MIRVGTCSWTEKTLIKSGEFYPGGMRSAEDRLRYYAENFSTVEVDSTYYAIPNTTTSSLWAERTPENFIFHIKAYGALTGHGVDPRTLPPDIAGSLPAVVKDKKYVYIKKPALLESIAGRFRDALLPLLKTGKLGIIVFQFPPWFQYSPARMEGMAELRGLMNGLDIAVEFRHGSWLLPERVEPLLRFLSDHGITYVAADEPRYGSLATVPFIPAVTTQTAYFRFHGRNRENWLRRGVETSLRYDYRYSDDELEEFVPPVMKSAATATSVFTMFNNCHGASAVKNAISFKELLKRKKADTG
ncbi:MAG: DUF72 domain-containing protein [Candidatus Sulfobium sp.]|jgi:uncharacterized protein YecE (DUF72 family)